MSSGGLQASALRVAIAGGVLLLGCAGLAGAAPQSVVPPGRIVYPLVQGGSASLFTAAADGTGSAQLTGSTSSHNDYAPRWSPDGRQVAFTRVQPHTTYEIDTEIEVVNADGTAPRALTRYGSWSELPQWSPDGKRLAYWARTRSTDDLLLGNDRVTADAVDRVDASCEVVERV